ncbi:MAG TPA: porin family protein [Halalkalibaculum sp.]|nr:porin family protein [Halalkalibaculum sp.]
MKSFLYFLLGLFLLVATENASAQSPLSWEVRTGVDFATQDLGDADLNTGFGFEGTLSYSFMPHLSVYAGWGWHRFSADDSFAGSDTDFEETGYTFGLQYMHPIGTSQTEYFIRGGAIYNHIETENDAGDITADSDHGLGWQAGAGLAFELGNRWKLMPGIRYRSLSRDIDIGNTTTDIDLTYIELGVGLSRSF